ncbi:hypothetical protein Goshw_013736 [Gossypium schwendimanii]|uniref:RNase H type-1 domain-containing protein n=1 Tax=Gossypium schwendimanii TaxID=34291 RepID=A0A7J9LAJ3_GOSSC|nr:hypothetical protein [Gossypium schwendimanii]
MPLFIRRIYLDSRRRGQSFTCWRIGSIYALMVPFKLCPVQLLLDEHLDGLSLIQDKHFEGVLIQVDSLKMIEAIQEFSSTDSSSTLIRRIHQILAKVGHWVIEYIPNELNEIAA